MGRGQGGRGCAGFRGWVAGRGKGCGKGKGRLWGLDSRHMESEVRGVGAEQGEGGRGQGGRIADGGT